jgi:hypothetical protein
MYSETINQVIEQAVERMLVEMRAGGPQMAHQVEDWIKSLATTERPADYFQHPLAFPMLLLPWWMEESLRRDVDVVFQADLIYSSINGYYFIRMIDNVMDGHSTVEQKLLPVLGFFHFQFHAVYHSYFGHDHPFWRIFKTVSLQSAESAMHDAMLTEIDLHQFTTIAGMKVAGGKIPLAAVGYQYDQPQHYEEWLRFYDKLGCWHQMYNDLFGWVKDLRNGTPTYFLSEGQRRKQPAQPLAAWVIHEGFAWGIATLETWLDELRQLAEMLQSRALIDYLQERQKLMHEQAAEVARAFGSLERLFGV